MAEKSLFWFTDGFNGATGDGAAPYTQDEFSRYNLDILGEGVVYGVGNNLEVSGTATPLDLETGRAQVQGFSYWNSSASTLAVTTPTTGTTGGRVVLRADYSAATVRTVVKLNTDGNAGIPALTQVANTTWEISLATFTVTTGGVITVTDDRVYANVIHRKESIGINAAWNYTDSVTLGAIFTRGLGIPDTVQSGITAQAVVTNNCVLSLPVRVAAIFEPVLSGNAALLFDLSIGGDGQIGTTTSSSEVVPMVIDTIKKVAISGDISSLLSPGDYIHIRLIRDAISASDTISASILARGFEIEFWEYV